MGVDDRVQGVGGDVRDVAKKVEDVNDKVEGIDDGVKDVGDNVQIIDRKLDDTNCSSSFGPPGFAFRNLRLVLREPPP